MPTVRTDERLSDVSPLLRDMMRDHGLTEQGLADEVGVTRMAVWYWLHGGVRAKRAYARLVEQAAGRLRRRKVRSLA